jgi:hypothetical protein
MTSPVLTKNFLTGAATEPYRLVKLTGDDQVEHAAASTDTIIGATTEVSTDGADERQDVHVVGIAEVELGGNVSRSDYVRSDADGKAVTASPSGGTNAGIAGIALDGGVDGDIVDVLLVQTQIQG